ncbi:hypothetical protein GIB67_022068 [Kingdonia uniflora]|uniref:Pentatricopeptide repeat-containing protein n=1 Tax=Kingdonia uniflora TaxID=39325 RepID=A0A7J7MU58_9MAGN|nr:hypothetical protein GIB67_022068 [Kingdonia uniflora]
MVGSTSVDAGGGEKFRVVPSVREVSENEVMETVSTLLPNRNPRIQLNQFFRIWFGFSVVSLKSALDLLRTVEFDTVSYNTLIWGFCKEGLVKQVVGVLSKMIKKDVVIDSFTLNVLIKGFCRVGLLGNAELMMDKFVKVGIDRDIVKVNCVEKLFGVSLV